MLFCMFQTCGLRLENSNTSPLMLSFCLGFGQVTSRSNSTSSSNLQFRVAEINREDCLDDRQQLFREAAANSNKTNMTPFKNTSGLNGHVTPVKPGTIMTPNNKNNR